MNISEDLQSFTLGKCDIISFLIILADKGIINEYQKYLERDKYKKNITLEEEFSTEPKV